jgi:hypothetical protein
MKELLEKLLTLGRKNSDERGDFILFALFLREDAEDRWDLVISASWLDAKKKESFEYLAGQLKFTLNIQELLIISRIVILDQENPGLDAIARALHAEHSIVEVRDSNFFGLQIKHAYIITSKVPMPMQKTKTG